MTLTCFGHVALPVVTVSNMKPRAMQHLILKIFLGNFFYTFVKEPRGFHIFLIYSTLNYIGIPEELPIYV